MENYKKLIDRDLILSRIKQKIENHYADKFTYALPEWAIFTGEPQVIATLTIYGKEGLQIAKQRVNFEVDFNSDESIVHYVDFLKDQMNIELENIGYVFFYNTNLLLVQDPDYTEQLTPYQIGELQTYNKNIDRTATSLLMVDKNLKEVSNLDQILELT